LEKDYAFVLRGYVSFSPRFNLNVDLNFIKKISLLPHKKIETKK